MDYSTQCRIRSRDEKKLCGKSVTETKNKGSFCRFISIIWRTFLAHAAIRRNVRKEKLLCRVFYIGAVYGTCRRGTQSIVGVHRLGTGKRGFGTRGISVLVLPS